MRRGGGEGPEDGDCDDHSGSRGSRRAACTAGTGTISTASWPHFGADARYDDEPWAAHYAGRTAVAGFYADLLRALPDLVIDVRQWHSGASAVVLETVIGGRHHATWRGLPATGRHVEFPLGGIFSFDAHQRLAGERIYYDRTTVLRQLGVFHEPETVTGRVTTALMHPLTMARVAARMPRQPH